jgi:hypothetical protein
MLTAGTMNKLGRQVAMLSLLAPTLFLPAQQQSSRPAYSGIHPVQQNNTQRPAYQPTNPAPAGATNRSGNTQPNNNIQGHNTLSPRPPDLVRPYSPPGHLADWLSQHRDLPPQQQEQLLRRDPYFNHLNPAEQRKVINQLYRVNEMNDQQRQRRMARAEAIERLSPQEKMQVNASAQRMQILPEPRRQMLIRAFRDLRAVPFEQRDAVLSSVYYRTTFSPDERLILHDLLKVEPYEPLR